MTTLDATGEVIIEGKDTMKVINGKLKIVRVGAFMDKNGECYSQLRWYVPTWKEVARYKRQCKHLRVTNPPDGGEFCMDCGECLQ